MKIGFRVPSLKKRLSARTSVKRAARHRLGVKAPRGLGVVTNPKKAMYNRLYNRTTIGVGDLAPKQKKGKKRTAVEIVPPRTAPVHRRTFGFWRFLLCFAFPPLAVAGASTGAIILVTVLTLLGWVPGVIAALVIAGRR